MRLVLFAAALTPLIAVTPAFADAANSKTAASDPDQAIKCRRVDVTGSHVKKGKVCKTVAEWKRIIENGNRTARAVVLEGAKPTN
jgi:hypothetical protein